MDSYRLRFRYRLLSPPETGGTRSEAEGVDKTPLAQNINPQTLAITGVPADWVITKVVER